MNTIRKSKNIAAYECRTVQVQQQKLLQCKYIHGKIKDRERERDSTTGVVIQHTGRSTKPTRHRSMTLWNCNLYKTWMMTCKNIKTCRLQQETLKCWRMVGSAKHNLLSEDISIHIRQFTMWTYLSGKWKIHYVWKHQQLWWAALTLPVHLLTPHVLVST